MPSHSSLFLPPELWIDIFRYATHHESLYAADYDPFREALTECSEHDDTLAIKYAIVRVCRQWRALGTEMLYEDLRIARGVGALKHALEEDDELCMKGVLIPARGRWVRRAELEYSQSATPTSSPPPALDILRHCPHLEVLVRPARTFHPLLFEFPAEAPPLPSLKRIDWWHDNDAARTGGINSLDEVLSRTPKLEYLSLAGNMSLGLLRQQRHVELPALKVLRLRNVNPIFVRQVCIWSLPSLSHVIVDALPPYQALDNIWETFGEGIQCVQLGSHMRFLTEDHLATVVASCPRLCELNYYIFFTAPPHFTTPHPSLHSVGLHAHPNLSIHSHDTDPEEWRCIEEHFGAYDPDLFPSMKEFVLYGDDWRDILHDARFEALEDKIRERGQMIVFSSIRA